jgi:hypothetical protein
MQWTFFSFDGPLLLLLLSHYYWRTCIVENAKKKTGFIAMRPFGSANAG